TNKNSLTMFTALQMNTDILAISQEGGDWRIDLASSQTEMQLATSFISPSQALINLPQEDFASCKTSAQADWENLLHRFDIIETGEADRTFFDH
ncbi:alpha-mannosidase, partial [Klebsiella pneumoniae]|nr:alpha-mannosidase [Klebsiella pneumoniae]